MFSYSIELEVKTEKLGEFIGFCVSISYEFQKEEGYNSLSVYRNRENTTSYYLVSEWDSETSMQNHLRGDNFSLLKGGTIVLGSNFKLKTKEIPETDYVQWEKMNLPL